MQQKEFEKQYLPQWQCMYSLAGKMLASEDEAADVVQDAFERLLAHTDTLDEVTSPRAYCLTLTRRLCIDRLRRTAVRRSVETDAELLPEKADAASLPAESAQETEFIIRAIDSLPPQQALVMKLRVCADLDNNAIAAETGFSPETVRQHLCRARKKLKELIFHRK